MAITLMETVENSISYGIWKHLDDHLKTPETLQEKVEGYINDLSQYEFLRTISVALEEMENERRELLTR